MPFAKSDDEHDLYLYRIEGFLLFIDQAKSQEELDTLKKEFEEHLNEGKLNNETIYEVIILREMKVKHTLENKE